MERWVCGGNSKCDFYSYITCQVNFWEKLIISNIRSRPQNTVERLEVLQNLCKSKLGVTIVFMTIYQFDRFNVKIIITWSNNVRYTKQLNKNLLNVVTKNGGHNDDWLC